MNKIDVSKYFKVFDDGCEYFMEDMVDELYKDIVNQNKQIQQLEVENKKLKSYLNKIREEELNSLDIEWDEYETECRTTDYSNIVTLVEEALGENNE